MLVTILKVRKCHRKSYVKWKPARIFLSKQLRNCNLVIQQPSKIFVNKFKMADNWMFMVFSKKCLWFSLGGGQLIFSIRWVSKTLCWQIFSVVFEVWKCWPWDSFSLLLKWPNTRDNFWRALNTWVVILTNRVNWFHERNFQTQAHKTTKLVMTPHYF